MGDGGPATDPLNNAQNLAILHGSMIRISVPSFEGAAEPYQIPAGNYQGKLFRRLGLFFVAVLLLRLVLVSLPGLLLVEKNVGSR